MKRKKERRGKSKVRKGGRKKWANETRVDRIRGMREEEEKRASGEGGYREMGERGSKAEEGEGEGGYRKSGKRGRKRKKEEENVKGYF